MLFYTSYQRKPYIYENLQKVEQPHRYLERGVIQRGKSKRKGAEAGTYFSARRVRQQMCVWL